ncbi:MAG: hypothetical protein ACJ75H_03770 [Thermoanaerobaculia bacterium]
MRATVPYRWTCTLLAALLLGLIAWTPAPAHAEEEPGAVGRCLAFNKDMTDPALSEILQQGGAIPAGPARMIYLRSGKKISQQTFMIGGGLEKLMQATVTCTGTCTGGCGVSGCDVTSSLGCSGCSCTGGACSDCTCTKKSTVVSDSR